MKIVVVGGGGFIGSKVLNILSQYKEHEVINASPSGGIDVVNHVAGELDEVFGDADIVIDAINWPLSTKTPSTPTEIEEFFEKSTRNILKAEKSRPDHQIKHHVLLSIVGLDEIASHHTSESTSSYFRGKRKQEEILESQSEVPFTILRCTQFYEFVQSFARIFATDDGIILPDVYSQAIDSEDAAEGIIECALGQPLNGVADLAGPEAMKLEEYVRLSFPNESVPIKSDPAVPYFGATFQPHALVPQQRRPLTVKKRFFEDWLVRSGKSATSTADASPTSQRS